MFRTNANTIMGERECTASELFRRGCATMRRTPAEMSSSEKIYGIPSQRRRLTATAFPTRGSQLEQRFSASFGAEGGQGHVLFTTAWKVDFFLHKNKVLKIDRNVVGDQVHRLKKWDSCTPTMLSSPTLLSCTSQPESPVPLAPCTTC